MTLVHPLLVPVSVGISILAWGAVIQRAPRLYHHLWSVGFWTYWAGFLALALMITLPLPAVQAALDHRSGLPGLALFLQELAALAACWCWLLYLADLEDALSPRQARVFAALAALVVATAGFMALRFTLAPGRHEFVRLAGAHDTATRYLAVQRLAYRGAMLIHVILGLRLLRGYSVRVRSRPALWARMRAMGWVLDFMLLYAVYECLTILVAPVPDLGAYLNRLRAYLMVLVLVAPSAWYARAMVLARRLTRDDGPLASFGHWRTHRRLLPLWRALWPVDPSLSLLPAPGRRNGWLPGRRLAFRLYREAFEIRDWSIKVRRYVPPQTTSIARTVGREADLPPADVAALVQAASIAAGLRGWHRSPADVPGHPRPAVGDDDVAGDTLAGEVDALARVADFFAHSPLVPAILARVYGMPTQALVRGERSNRAVPPLTPHPPSGDD